MRNKLFLLQTVVAIVAFESAIGRAEDGSMRSNDPSAWNLPVQAAKVPKADELHKLVSDAAKGEMQAQTELGLLYYHGRGVPKDPVKALDLWHKAAAQGDAQAENNLGIAYALGGVVPQNYEEAAKWDLKAAEKGHPIAQFNLGFMYATGEGVPRDLVRGFVWSSLAAEQAIKPAQDNASKIFSQMTAIEKTNAEKLLKLKKSASLAASD